jgi:hypothetical protein
MSPTWIKWIDLGYGFMQIGVWQFIVGTPNKQMELEKSSKKEVKTRTKVDSWIFCVLKLESNELKLYVLMQNGISWFVEASKVWLLVCWNIQMVDEFKTPSD